jgi:hypothetical protein
VVRPLVVVPRRIRVGRMVMVIVLRLVALKFVVMTMMTMAVFA